MIKEGNNLIKKSSLVALIDCVNTQGCENDGQIVSTTPLQQWGFRQCLPFSWTTLIGKHCRHPIAEMGVVDTFGPCQYAGPIRG